jgi:hypothetical protein
MPVARFYNQFNAGQTSEPFETAQRVLFAAVQEDKSRMSVAKRFRDFSAAK